MLKYYKEKNFIVAFDPNETNKLRGKWDITTGVFYGVRGTPVKSRPKAMDDNTLYDMHRWHNEENNLPDAIYNALCLYLGYSGVYGYPSAIANRLEQLISLNLTADISSETWKFMKEDTLPLTKNVVNFLNEYCNGEYSPRNIQFYKFALQNPSFVARCHDRLEYGFKALQSYIMLVDPEEHYDGEGPVPLRTDNYDYKQYLDVVKDMICYGISEHVYYSHSHSDLSRLLFKMIKNMLILGHKVEAKRNLLTNDVYYQSLRREYEEAHYDEVLRNNANMPWLYYENDEYIVRPLLTRTEFHDEAEAQRNCVESMYMSKVYEGRTHVVTIRKKSDPNHSYITCEVSKQTHEIAQYLLARNSRPTDARDINFYHEYQRYLKSSL